MQNAEVRAKVAFVWELLHYIRIVTVIGVQGGGGGGGGGSIPSSYD